MLYIIATPIGNLKDITLRSIETLRACDFIIAENPSYSKRLLQYIDSLPVIARSASNEAIPEDKEIATSSDTCPPSLSLGDDRRAFGLAMTNKKELVQFAEHNEQQIVKELTRRLAKETGCLVTDAGTPGISDPGFRLVRECVKENIIVVPLPGANAALTALSASGLPTDRFIFLGFLQKTAAKTLAALKAAEDAKATAIFYESPERILKTLSYVTNAFPASQVVVARELTKVHEEFLRGSPVEVLEALKSKPSIKGEITVLLSFK